MMKCLLSFIADGKSNVIPLPEGVASLALDLNATFC
jgi:hypothetical protein